MLKPLATKIESELVNTLKEFSEETRISQAKLIREALEDLFKKHGKEVKK